MPERLLVDVFCGPGHTAGNRLAVILDDPSGPVERQRRAAELGWVSGRPEWVTGRTTRQLASPAEVDALPVPPDGTGFLYVWAWTDEPAGSVRARAFPWRGDAIVEDEATGAAALRLTAELGRSLTVRQGVGSEIRTRLLPEGRIGVGGRVRRVRPDPQDARRTS
ncbi:hypothetical protein [Pseudonocardia sp. NPDC046786]|uniref:hypothetical protein n=1 Tax=Pseudonocardia sp. NPDC046786 TaxID=3155471 RepID=UPI003401A64A